MEKPFVNKLALSGFLLKYIIHFVLCNRLYGQGQNVFAKTICFIKFSSNLSVSQMMAGKDGPQVFYE